MKLSTAEMRARGYSSATIADEERLQVSFRAGLALIPRIAEAFAGVTLGGGVGLSEGRALDDYEDAATRAAYRAADEKDDWSRIGSEALCDFHSSLFFFDPEGMRFHLPAFLTADLRGEFGFGMVFCLTHSVHSENNYFGLLSADQRSVVRQYLLYLAECPDHQHDLPHILRALDDYWK